ncbi:MAG: mechanosensitive ion channel family protein, partial [Halobacteria archaeon]|nr:mechanosensitive ion channel family protein [Halobacteria archaeon]
RRELDTDVNGTEKRRIACEQIAQSSQELIERIQSRQNAALKARLLARGVSTPGVVVDVIGDPRPWSRLVAGFLDEGSGWERLSPPQRWVVLTVFVVLLIAAVVWRRRWFQYHRRDGDSQPFIMAVPWLLAGAGVFVALMIYLPGWPPPLITRLVLGILAWLGIDVFLRIWLVGRRSAGLAAHDAITLDRWLKILVGLLILGGLISTAEAVIRLPDPHYLLLRTIMVWLLFVSLLWSAVILGRVPGLAGMSTSRLLLVVAVLIIAVAETAGYRNLSDYLLLGFGGTVIGLGVFSSVSSSFVYFYDGLDQGRYAWQKMLRRWMHLKAREVVPGLIWLRLATSLLVWSIFLLWFLWVWGQSEHWLSQLVEYATEGFSVGSLRIAPVQLLGAITVLAAGISLSGWFKKRVVTELVKRTRLDRGGREAMVTVSGYAGVLISLLIALGVAGISYTNLAIIAGALSVGIGFGLQNVVNNFVSGLILLFERPVRTGDWIVVGDTQGYVRKISIRSTQIETFDRADVIVPNSELISNKVSNLMLRDPWGRIIIPVGVAYGSDVAKVITILVRVAREHEGVLVEQPGVSPPKALFRRFGDSALEFELRCFIRQIDRMIDITHELNVAIDREFRAAGITIPFPQRDIHVRTIPPGDIPKGT